MKMLEKLDKSDFMKKVEIYYEDYRNLILGTIGIVSFLLFWQWLGTSGIVNPLFTSSPAAIFARAVRLFQDGSIWHDISVSGREFFYGYFLAVLIGIPIGIVTGWYKTAYGLANPFISALYATPRIALIGLIIIWFGVGLWSKVVLVFLGAIFPIIVNTQSAIVTMDEDILKAGRSFGASDGQIFCYIALPGCVPFIITGLRLAAGRGLLGVVVGEMYAATAGVGYMIIMAGATFQIDLVFVGVSMIAGTGVLMDQLLRGLERKFDAWRPQRV